MAERPVDWETCEKEPGCIGLRIADDGGCLRHCRAEQRELALAMVASGGDVSVTPGVVIDDELLGQLLAATRSKIIRPDFRRTTFEDDANFEGAAFEGFVTFEEATFQGRANFRRTTFEDDADFEGATFEAYVTFEGATFKGWGHFEKSIFRGAAIFRGATFEAVGWFSEVRFEAVAAFHRATFGTAIFQLATFEMWAAFDEATFRDRGDFIDATFQDRAVFEGATFEADAIFRHVTFERERRLGFLLCAGSLVLDHAHFKTPTTVVATALEFTAIGTSFAGGVTLHLRRATTVLGVYLGAKTVMTSYETPHPREEDLLGKLSLGFQPRLLSLLSTDARNLVIGDVDLRACTFGRAHSLDLIRIEPTAKFADPPARRTGRRIVAEEYTARSRRTRPWAWRAIPSSSRWPEESSERFGQRPLDAAGVARVYRALRKSLEDGGDKPGATDFYYGEMEMRRQAADTPRHERGLLWLYWLVSGYGTVAWRAVASFGVIAIAASLLWYTSSPFDPYFARPAITEFGDMVQFTFESMLGIFRAPGDNLDYWEKWLQLGLRITGPILLGLAALATRMKIKR